MNNKIEDIDNKDSELISSDDYYKETSQLQFEETYWLQGVHQTTDVLPNVNQTIEKLSRRFC